MVRYTIPKFLLWVARTWTYVPYGTTYRTILMNTHKDKDRHRQLIVLSKMYLIFYIM